MTHHTRLGLSVFAWIVCACIFLFPPLVSNAWTDQRIESKVHTLIDTLTDQDRNVRLRAAGLLVRIGRPAAAAVPALIEALKDGDRDIRADAAIALGKIGPQTRVVIPILLAALKDEDRDVRWNAAWALRWIAPQAPVALPALIEALKDGDKVVRVRAAWVLEMIAFDLQNANAKDKVHQLKPARDALMAHPDPEVKSHAESVRRAVEILESGGLQAELLQWIREHLFISAAIAAYLLLFPLWLTFLWFRPLWLYRINEALKPYTDFVLPAQLGGVKVPVRHVLLVGFFHYPRRMLDAWVSKHIPTAREEFQKKDTVRDRAVHIPSPVLSDGTIIAHLTPEHLRPTFNRSRACLLIWGEGGTGKTSLACQIAKWAMAEEPSLRLCDQHLMLPVLIEHDVDTEIAAGKHPFTEAIRGELRALINAEDPIPEELLLQLLRRRHVLVIVDRLSEMHETTHQAIYPGHPEFPANALVVTSRIEDKLGGVSKASIKPLRIQGNRLSSFMEAYLTQRGKRDLFDDAGYFEACRKLSVMVGARDITVLLAKLYAEQMIAAKEDVADRQLPENIPDLMLSYVNEVNRGVEEPKLEDRTVHRCAKAIAWECLRETYRPTAAKRDAVLVALAGEKDAEAALKYLEERLRLVQTVGAGRDQMRFALDPLAEYLAGLHLVEQYRADEEPWREFLARAQSMPGAPEVIRSFLLAVRDCCMAKGSEAKVPDFVPIALATEAGLDSELVNYVPHA
jgi:HEAT repeat protein